MNNKNNINPETNSVSHRSKSDMTGGGSTRGSARGVTLLGIVCSALLGGMVFLMAWRAGSNEPQGVRILFSVGFGIISMFLPLAYFFGKKYEAS